MGEHVHGTQDPTEQRKAFNGLMKGAVIVIVISVAILVFLAFVGT